MKTNIENIDINNLPKYLDEINFEYKGIQFHVHGVLHALTGGTNQEYVRHVNETIAQAKGLKLCEKSMKSKILLFYVKLIIHIISSVYSLFDLNS